MTWRFGRVERADVSVKDDFGRIHDIPTPTFIFAYHCHVRGHQRVRESAVRFQNRNFKEMRHNSEHILMIIIIIIYTVTDISVKILRAATYHFTLQDTSFYHNKLFSLLLTLLIFFRLPI